MLAVVPLSALRPVGPVAPVRPLGPVVLTGLLPFSRKTDERLAERASSLEAHQVRPGAA